eukprot:ANDGO_05122.mRNA.1 hypothetical protein
MTVGKPTSGRVWKQPREAFVKTFCQTPTPAVHPTYLKRRAADAKLASIRQISRMMKEEKKMEKEAEKERIKKVHQRRLENEKKAEVVQTISNPQKIKKMSKKQLQNLHKR